MELKIIKRNGDIVPFNKEKIINAIRKAYQEVYGEKEDEPFFYEIANNIEDILIAVYNESNEWVNVEEIQDLVEDLLSDCDIVVGKVYIRYRYKRGVMRSCSDEFIRAIAQKLRALNVQNQNANIDEHSFGGRVGEASDEMMRHYALDFCMSEMAKRNHLNNEIYIHDLSAYAVGMHNCLSIPFDKLLAEGFNTRQTDVRPANSINTAFQLIAVIFQLQSLMQFGGVSATHLDWTMVPYVRKSFWKHFKDGVRYCFPENERLVLKEELEEKNKIQNEDFSNLSITDEKYLYSSFYPRAYDYAMDMTERELQQAVEGMYHNLNTL